MPFQLSLEKATDNFMKTCLKILVLFSNSSVWKCTYGQVISWNRAELCKVRSGKTNRKTNKKWNCFFLATYWLWDLGQATAHSKNSVKLNSIHIMVIILHVGGNGGKERLVIRDCWIKEDVHHILISCAGLIFRHLTQEKNLTYFKIKCIWNFLDRLVDRLTKSLFFCHLKHLLETYAFLKKSKPKFHIPAILLYVKISFSEVMLLVLSALQDKSMYHPIPAFPQLS